MIRRTETTKQEGHHAAGAHRLTLLLAMVMAVCCLAPAMGLCEPEYVTTSQMVEDVKAGWHQTYSAYGRTIDVSIDIDFPSVDAVPVIQVRGAAPDLTGVSEPEAWTLEDGYFIFVRDHQDQPQHNGGWYKASIEMPADQIDWDKPMTEEHPSTPRQAYDMITAQLRQAFPEEVLQSLLPTSVMARGHLYQFDRATQTFGEPLDDRSLYELYFTQQFHDIPIVYSNHGLFNVSLDGELFPPLCRLSALVTSDGSLDFSGGLIEEAAMIQDDIPLMNIGQVIGQYEKLIAAGLLREVRALRFGYILCIDPEHTELAYTIPVWELNGVLYDTAAQEAPVMPATETMKDTRPYRSVIVFAQSGELLDANRVDPQRRYAPDILSWEEAQPD